MSRLRMRSHASTITRSRPRSISPTPTPTTTTFSTPTTGGRQATPIFPSQNQVSAVKYASTPQRQSGCTGNTSYFGDLPPSYPVRQRVVQVPPHAPRNRIRPHQHVSQRARQHPQQYSRPPHAVSGLINISCPRSVWGCHRHTRIVQPLHTLHCTLRYSLRSSSLSHSPRPFVPPVADRAPTLTARSFYRCTTAVLSPRGG